MAKGNSKPKGVHVTQSAYRPMARPASRISQSSAPPGLLTLWSSSGIKKRAASESEVKPLRKPLSQKLLTLWSNSDIKKRAASESEIKPSKKGEKPEIVVSLAPKKEERKLDLLRKVQKKEQPMKSEGATSIKGKPSAGHHFSPSIPPKSKSEGASSSKGKPSAGHLWSPSTPPKTKSEGATSSKGKPSAAQLLPVSPSTPPKSTSERASSSKGKKPSAAQLLPVSPSTPPKSKSEGATSSKGKPSAGHHLGPSTPIKSKSSVRRRPRQHRRSTGIVLEVPLYDC